MMLRWLMTSYAHQAARQAIQQAVSQTWRQVSGQPVARPAGELPPCDVALLLATEVEAEGLTRRLDERTTTRCATFLEHVGQWGGLRVVVAECGLGARTAETAAADVIAIHRPAWVVSTGFAAALADDVRRGQILMADRVIDADRREWTVGSNLDRDALEQTRGLRVGGLLSVDRLVHRTEEKRSLAQQYDALACDLQSAAVAEACRRAATRFLAVRVITDTVDDRWSPEIEALLDQRSWAGKLGAATGATWRRPGWVKDLLRLQEQAELASNRLAHFCAGLLPQLVHDGHKDSAD